MESLLRDFQVEHENPSQRWRRAVAILKSPRLRFRHVAYLAANRNEIERKKHSIQGTTSIRDDENNEIQLDSAKEISEFPPGDSSSPGTSPATFYTCPEPEEDDDDACSHKAFHRTNSFIRMDGADNDHNLTFTDVQQVNPGHNENRSKIKVLEWIFSLANFFVELMSIAFDQLSSQHKGFILFCLILSIIAVLISISELVYKLRKEKAIRKKVRRHQRWFDNPSSGVRLVFILDIVELTCGFGQLIINTVNYSWYRKHGNVPIKISIWPAIFAFVQLFSRLWATYHRRGTSG